MSDSLSVRIGTAKDLYKSPTEAYCKVKVGGAEIKSASRMAKKTKDAKWAWNELIQIKKEPTDNHVVIEVWTTKLMKKKMLCYVTVDVSDPKLPQTATWYNLGKPKSPISRGEIELTFETSLKTPRAKVSNLSELDQQLGLSFTPQATTPRKTENVDPSFLLKKLEGEEMCLSIGETELYPLKLTKISCDVMTVKVKFESTLTGSEYSSFTLWLPQQGLSWNSKEYKQSPYVRGELSYSVVQPRPCFKITVNLSEDSDDLGAGVIDAKLISDKSKSALALRGAFKVSKSAIQKAIQEDSHYDAAHVYDEREILDVSFKAIPEKVQACLDRWDDVNIQNEARETPLHRAVMNGSQQIISMLIERGADPRISDKFGQTPVDIAEKYFKKDLIPLLRTYQ